MIEAVNFSKEYKTLFSKPKTAVSDVSFCVKPGSITGLLGPNGAGKTTIIKAICSIHYPTSGNIFVYDRENNKFDTSVDIEKSRNLIGYVSENPYLYKSFSVIEYLKMIMDIRKISEKKALEKVIEDFKLTDVLKQKISTLSKGYTQRVSFAASLIHNPEILILDEPASGLDPDQIIETRNIIKKLSKDKTILLSTHIMSEAEKLCDSAVIISHGKLLASDSIDIIKKNQKASNLEEAYINLTKKAGVK
ncbi:MAG: ABC transporter ATP-binding protein [Treponema sp.]|uniref:ABC transporter ATP-binding protein n=1 Tax=Treponema sp. TaxID=166 RepID=UPI00298E52A1|nr:ABC transporter ATP-binding protein [Treponema sp.]MBR5934452.1 ABC transporter ATP-binding protein [Treponema sp.]